MPGFPILDYRFSKNMYEIETERLLLRRFSLADVDEIHAIYCKYDVMQYAGGIRTRGQVENYIEKMLKSWEKNQFGMWAIAWKNEDIIIGDAGLCFLEKTSEIEVGYVLDKPYWNLGVATEVTKASLRYGFEVLNLDKIVAVANPKNFASRRVMEKVGMTYEKDAFYYNSDVVYYSISKSDCSSDGSLFVLHE